jgi:hypothetical protein
MVYPQQMGSITKLFQAIRNREHRTALFVAMAADAVQIAVLPLFVEGGISPADVLVDVAAAFALSKLIGWHWAFLPSFVAELTPGLDLFPTWTAAALYVIWRREPTEDQEPPRVIRPVQLPR